MKLLAARLPKFAEVRKTVAVVVGLVAEAVASGVLSGTVLHVAQAVLAVATAAGVYLAPNRKPVSTETVPLPVLGNVAYPAVSINSTASTSLSTPVITGPSIVPPAKPAS